MSNAELYQLRHSPHSRAPTDTTLRSSAPGDMGVSSLPGEIGAPLLPAETETVAPPSIGLFTTGFSGARQSALPCSTRPSPTRFAIAVTRSDTRNFKRSAL